MQAGRPQQIGMRRPVYDPYTEICQDLLGLLAGHPQLPRGRNIEFRKHLNAQRAAAIFREATEKFYGSIVLGSRTAVVRIDEDVGVHELNAHGVRPVSNGSLRECPDPERSQSAPRSGARHDPRRHPGRSFCEWIPPSGWSSTDCASPRKCEIA